MKIILSLKSPIVKPLIPIEAEVISPDIFAAKELEEIKQLSIWRGNKEIPLGEVLDIKFEGEKEDNPKNIEIILNGDFSRFKRIGQYMTAGSIVVNGSIGMHLGFKMSGGKILIKGNADDFAGANMEGGEIHIHGNAGHYLGGSIRGEWRGMSKGKIIVEGNVGNECGVWMRNGLIEILGNTNIFLGMHLHRGTIITHGDVAERAGAEMTGGTIVILGKVKDLLPSFEFKSKISEIEIEDYGKLKGPFLEFEGDFAERKQGIIYLLEKKNEHLLYLTN
ncbi:MAG: formylmethanofuran dehydrogenase subunit C [Candidatus Heimdallarchaeota archaeon]|nr:formylmethanofuran dehydrogenase subunit C [Candidatus Heimdallarchaeota archaeon]